jgi:hypothetical protein
MPPPPAGLSRQPSTSQPQPGGGLQPHGSGLTSARALPPGHDPDLAVPVFRQGPPLPEGVVEA